MHSSFKPSYRRGGFAAVFLSMLLAAACADDPVGPPAESPVASVEVTPDTVRLMVGAERSLVATPRAGDGRALAGRAVSWTSSDESVARVDASGRVTALGNGSATIRARSEGRTGEARILVGEEYAPVATVLLTPDTLRLALGATDALHAVLRAADGALLNGRAVAWTSSDPGVATVDAAGRVTARAVGAATVRATSEGRQGEARVLVSPQLPPVASVQVLPDSFDVVVGATRALTAAPRDAHGGMLAGRTIVWSSSDPSVARVDAIGLVTAMAAGSVEIRATSEGVVGVARVRVTPPPVASISIRAGTLDLSQGVLDLIPDQLVHLSASLRAADGSVLAGRPVTWSSSDSTVVRINPVTGTAVGVAGGTVTITARAEGVEGRASLRVPLWLVYGMTDHGNGPLPLLLSLTADTTVQSEVAMTVVERRVWLEAGRFDVSTIDARYRQWFELQTTERTVNHFMGNIMVGPERPVGDPRLVHDHGVRTGEIDWIGNPIYQSSLFAGHRFVLPYPGNRIGIHQRVPGESTMAYYFGYRRHGAP
jgi:uncharacterized protein YjdB